LSTKRIQLIVAYDGTDFRGWAAQTGQRTVHGTLTEAVRQISGEEIEIIGASRTDGGAHAKGQSCHFDTTNPMPTENWVRALNDRLPPDVSVMLAKERSRRFHARFWAIGRRYRYRYLFMNRDPQRTRFAHWIGREPEYEAMAQAAKRFVGERDFRAFGEELEGLVNTTRIIYETHVRHVGDEIYLDVFGTAFIRGMMRRMAGFLLQVGQGQRPASDLGILFDPRERERITWPPVLPAGGLTLMKVEYGQYPREQVRTGDETTTEETEE